MQEACVRAGTASLPMDLLGLSLANYRLMLKTPALLTGYNLSFAEFNVKRCRRNLEMCSSRYGARRVTPNHLGRVTGDRFPTATRRAPSRTGSREQLKSLARQESSVLAPL